MFYLLVCRACWPEAQPDNLVGVMPFESPDARDQWAGKHTRATNHDKWFVIDYHLRGGGL